MTPDPKRPGNDAEPTAGRSPVPIWLVLIIGGLFYWGESYISDSAGGFQEDLYPPYHSEEALIAANPVSEEGQMFALGKAKFDVTCAACHQPTGLGKEGVAPPLVGSEWVLAPGPNRIAHIVLNGLTAPITVKGQPYNLTMVAWRDILTDKEIAAVLSYVRSSWGNNASAVTPEQIKAARADTHPGPMQGEDELKKLPEKL